MASALAAAAASAVAAGLASAAAAAATAAVAAAATAAAAAAGARAAAVAEPPAQVALRVDQIEQHRRVRVARLLQQRSYLTDLARGLRADTDADADADELP